MSSSNFLLILLLLISLLEFGSTSRKLSHNSNKIKSSFPFKYHNGSLLSGKISINLIWYGNFKPCQREIITDFISSLSYDYSSSESISIPPNPSVSNWWKSIDKFYNPKNKTSPLISLSLGTQFHDQDYSLGKSLTLDNIISLSTTTATSEINVVLTAADVTVNGFCLNLCGSHFSSHNSSSSTYIWVGNSETQCPDQCAWPFHKSIYDDDSKNHTVLIPPNNDVGIDGMIVNLATLMVGTVTNPYGDGFYMGTKVAALEAGSACSGIYGKGAYPGYAGEVLVDSINGGRSYNANGFNGRKYLLPSLFDPQTSTCSTLV